MRYTIANKMLIAILLPVIIVFSTALWLLKEMVYEYAENSLIENLSINTAAAAVDIGGKLSDMLVLSHLVSDVIANTDMNIPEFRASINQNLKSILHTNKNIYSSWVIFDSAAFNANKAGISLPNPDGALPPKRFMSIFVRTHDYDNSGDDAVVESFDVPGDQNASDNEAAMRWHTATLNAGEFYFDDHFGRDYKDGQKKLLVNSYTHPIFRGSQIIGYVGIDLKFDQITAVIDNIKKNSGHVVVLYSSFGNVVHTSSDKYKDRHINDFGYENQAKIMQAISEGKPYYEKTFSPLLQKEAYIFFQPVKIGNLSKMWSVGMEVPVESVKSTAEIDSQKVVNIVVLGFIILIIAIYFRIRTIITPIKSITMAADAISQGDLEYELPHYNKKDEIGSLNTSLNMMIFQLKEKLQSERNFSFELEKKVYERTRELEDMTDRADNAAMAKSQFLASMSHEIRTPMNAIMGMSELLLLEELNERQKHYAKDIKDSATGLLQIINDILDFSKIESGKLNLVKVHFNLHMLLENIGSIVTFAVKDGKINFYEEFSPDVPEYIIGDDVRIKQILVNILGNAVKFTSEGYVKLGVGVKDSNLIFTIKDTGTGIKEEEIPYIFSEFVQLDVRKNRAIKGTGLGLTITQDLVRMMSGSIEVTSTYGEGTTFQITIPFELGDKDLAEEAESFGGFISAPEAKILVVDDNEINLTVCKALLEICSIKCDTAISGYEAVILASTNDYDLIFMDHMMPGIDGIETTKRVRALGSNKVDVPIIALTANAIAGARDLFLTSGLNDFISKPIDKKQFNQVLTKWLPKDKVVAAKDIVLSPDRNKKETTVTAGQIGSINPGGSQIIKKAALLEGLDVLLGLSRVEGLENVYEKNLKIFCHILPNAIERMLEYLQAGNLPDFKIQVHGLKGSLLNIGAVSASNKAKELELASQEGNIGFCMENIEELIAELKYYSEGLEEIFKISADQNFSSKENGSPGELAAQLEQAVTFLKDFDSDSALSIIESLRGYDYGQDVNGQLAEICNDIESFDYLSSIDKIGILIQKGV